VQPGEEPRRVVILCATLSGCVLMLGQLDAVAPFITMWFLTCYAIINGTDIVFFFKAWADPIPDYTRDLPTVYVT
jgi:hypothetical protein